MHVRVTRGQWADPTTFDSEAGQQLLQELVAAMKGAPGNQSYLTGADRASGRTVAISTWDTEDHARAALTAIGDIASRLQTLGLRIDPSEFFEVITT